MPKVKCLRLVGGQTLIGFVTTNWLRRTYTIVDCNVLILDANEDTQSMSVSFAPWHAYAKEYTFTVPWGQVVSCFEPRPALETNYKVATGNKRGE
tara:strand:+ start:1435 stop:1719 length:285 start_codon:yes stop_codon:yes gene_type:complete